MLSQDIQVIFADESHAHLAKDVSQMIDLANREPEAALARRSPEYIEEKIRAGKAVIALDSNGRVIGFCYVETWSDGQYVANSGLIVPKEYRKFGLGKLIKNKAFELSRKRFPSARVFGLTTNPAVMKINSDLGYRPVSYTELTKDRQFWSGCETCPYYDILVRLKRKNCLCTAMVSEPAVATAK